MRPPAPSVLLLDALGTLLELQPPAPALRAELVRRFGIDVEPGEAERALAAEIAYYRGHLQDGRDAASLADLRRRCAEVLRGALPPSERLAAVPASEMTEALLASLRFRPFSEVPDALRAARARGRRLVVVSNWDVSLVEVLARTGLAPLLDGVVTSAQVGARKPSPAIFERALELAGSPPSAALHLGDSFEEDVIGARAAGIRAVLVRRHGGDVPSDVAMVTGLHELQRIERP
jgi:putative hydrolase of the HAD superfamily